ncbi:hypothetical protein SAY86_019238 [Trapa natans]|uniref:Monocopper oxidase-like protein SKU5 n=1 Tax=Trapa natans TaxID=22666 RepID=A0AAN7LP61_TRANT|nr:hypothetical protein SAY86_019238 [Trapa natans]
MVTLLRLCLFYAIPIAFLSCHCFAADPTVSYDFKLSYIAASPLGAPRQVIAVNGKFPGPTINATTNYNVIVNIHNGLDEPFLMTWYVFAMLFDRNLFTIYDRPGIQMRKNSWQDGFTGTNCPIPAKWNWTYSFQVKDQIGSFFYSPSLNLQRASGGFGTFVINNRDIIPVPFGQPDGDIILTIGDWYTRNHTTLRSSLDAGKDLEIPDGVLINGKGPFRYNTSLVPDGISYETVNVVPGQFIFSLYKGLGNVISAHILELGHSSAGKTYRFRVHNVGTLTSLNFRIQNHNLL